MPFTCLLRFLVKSMTLQWFKLRWRNLVQRCFRLSSWTCLNVGHLDLLSRSHQVVGACRPLWSTCFPFLCLTKNASFQSGHSQAEKAGREGSSMPLEARPMGATAVGFREQSWGLLYEGLGASEQQESTAHRCIVIPALEWRPVWRPQPETHLL